MCVCVCWGRGTTERGGGGGGEGACSDNCMWCHIEIEVTDNLGDRSAQTTVHDATLR